MLLFSFFLLSSGGLVKHPPYKLTTLPSTFRFSYRVSSNVAHSYRCNSRRASCCSCHWRCSGTLTRPDRRDTGSHFRCLQPFQGRYIYSVQIYIYTYSRSCTCDLLYVRSSCSCRGVGPVYYNLHDVAHVLPGLDPYSLVALVPWAWCMGVHFCTCRFSCAASRNGERGT